MKDMMWCKASLAFSDPSWTSAGLHRIFRISVGDDWCDWTSRYCSYINTVQAKTIVVLFPEMDHLKIFLNHLLPAPLRLHSWMYINIYLLFKKNTYTRKQKAKETKDEKRKTKETTQDKKKKLILWTASVENSTGYVDIVCQFVVYFKLRDWVLNFFLLFTFTWI